MGADDEVRDWHYSSMNWEHPFMLDTVSSPFGGWGVRSLSVPGHGVMPVASHVRACLDLIEQGRYGEAQEMRDDYISNDVYDEVIMAMVSTLRDRDDWDAIDKFIGSEYLGGWLDYKQEHGIA